MDGLIKALRAYQQADIDGVMVVVSRQACEEAATELEKLEHRLAAAYQRGAHWWIENGKNVDNAEFISKASYDYADQIIETLNK
jgi:hypothetical protein